jgi:hypothetical protein
LPSILPLVFLFCPFPFLSLFNTVKVKKLSMFLFLWLFALNSFPFLPYWDFCLFEKEEQRKKRRGVVSLLSWLWPLQGKLLVFTKRVVTGMFLHYISYNLSNPDFNFFLGRGGVWDFTVFFVGCVRS